MWEDQSFGHRIMSVGRRNDISKAKETNDTTFLQLTICELWTLKFQWQCLIHILGFGHFWAHVFHALNTVKDIIHGTLASVSHVGLFLT